MNNEAELSTAAKALAYFITLVFVAFVVGAAVSLSMLATS